MAVQLACGALIDEADLPRIAGLSLRQYRGRVEFKLAGKTTGLHRYLMHAKSGECVDHINGDAMDNRRCNLRICTHAENMLNRRTHKNNTTGFKGVWRDSRTGLFVAQVTAFKVVHRFRGFKRAEDAYQAYVAKAAELHGQFFRAS